MSKTYSNKSNAIRGFKSLHPELAAGLDNKQISDRFISADGIGWNVVIPADVKVVKRHIYKGVQFRRNSVEPEGITSAVHGMFSEYAVPEVAAGVSNVAPQCGTCMDLGVVATATPSKYRNTYRGKSIEGRYIAPCPAVACKARKRLVGAPE